MKTSLWVSRISKKTKLLSSTHEKINICPRDDFHMFYSSEADGHSVHDKKLIGIAVSFDMAYDSCLEWL